MVQVKGRQAIQNKRAVGHGHQLASIVGLLALLAVVGALAFAWPPGNAAARRIVLAPLRLSQLRCSQAGGVWENELCFPADREHCLAAGGFWGLIGSKTGEGCNVVAPDAGQSCRNGFECTSGHCLGILDANARMRLTHGTAIPIAGMCAGLLRVRGCNAELHNGRVQTFNCLN